MNIKLLFWICLGFLLLIIPIGIILLKTIIK